MLEHNSEIPGKNQGNELPQKPWAQKDREILDFFSVEQKEGLSQKQVKKQRSKFGPNKFKKAKKKSVFPILINQVESIVVVVVAAVGTLSFVFQQCRQIKPAITA
ncbi:MAG: cation-transporting P-type ATPase [Bacillota bacterium]